MVNGSADYCSLGRERPNLATSNEIMRYAGVDMTDWDYSYKDDDGTFIYKAFLSVCNYTEEYCGCAGCPLKPLCFSKDGSRFWKSVLSKITEMKM